MSHDIFDMGYCEPEPDEEWSEGSDLDSSPANAKKSRKRRRAAARQVNDISSEEREQQQPGPLEDEDDPFAHVLVQQLQQQQPSKRQKRNGAASHAVLDSDDEEKPAPGPRSNGQTTAAECVQVNTTVLNSKTQHLAEAQRKLAERLAQLKELEQQEDADEPEVLEPSPPPAKRPQQPQPADEFLNPADDVDYVDSDPGASQQQTAAAAHAAAGDEGKLTLKFRAQGQEDVIVRIHANEPLQAALDRFRQYVRDQGWGTVSKFLSPDSEKLTGRETAEQLELEDEDVIEVYLS